MNAKEKFLRLLTCWLCWSFFVNRALAQTNDTSGLLSLAGTPPEQFHDQLSNYLSSHTSHFDVGTAAQSGWQAGLVAVIINSHLDHPAEHQQLDAIFPSPNIMGQTRYRAVMFSNVPDVGSVLELLWKGGALSPFDVLRNGFTNGCGLLPDGGAYIYADAVQTGTVFPAAFSVSQLLDAAYSDAPEYLRKLAAFSLPQRDTAEAQAALLQFLTDSNAPAEIRDEAFSGIAKFTPSYSWQLMNDSLSTWELDTSNGFSGTGFSVLGDINDPSARAFLRSVFADTNLPGFAREHALSAINPHDTDAFGIYSNILAQTNGTSNMLVVAANNLLMFPAQQITNLLEHLDLPSYAPDIQKALVTAPVSALDAGTNEYFYVRSLSQRTDLSPEAQAAAAHEANFFAWKHNLPP